MENKVCLKCCESKPIHQFRKIRKGNDNWDGYVNCCKECVKAYPRQELIVLGEKVCPKCNMAKPRTEFRLYGQKVLRLESICKVCRPILSRQVYAEKPTVWKKALTVKCREYRNINRAKVNQNQREYKQQNPDKWREYQRSWRIRNRQKENERQRNGQRDRTEKISDSYLRGMGIPDIQEILEAKRTIILLHREIKAIRRGLHSNHEQNGTV
jgi:hypothetical protein